jgi:lysyl-tRNA synthetase class 2
MSGDNQTTREEKLKKISELKAKGINIYPYSFNVADKIADIIAKYDDIASEEKTGKEASIAGRILTKRAMGRVLFLNIIDEDSEIQLFFRQNELSDTFEIAQSIDIGDIIGVKGEIFKTKTGELSIWVKSFEILNKSITGLVDPYYGLKDIELKYRNRSLDMITNLQSRNILKKRFQIIQKIREFFIKEGFLEVETPVLQVVYGGASATPFKTHHHKLDMGMYLRVAPEQYLKRIMVGGMESIFELAKCFRNENIDRTHNPEFTMVEAYKAYKDYNYMMDLIERLFEKIVLDIAGGTKIKNSELGVELDFVRPWKRMTIKQALLELAKIDVDKLSDQELIDKAISTKKEMNNSTRGEAILVLFEEYCEDKLIQPTHIVDYPKESTPFCKIHRDDPELIERFESFVAGREISNGYSELNDPVLQRELLEEQTHMAENGALETWGAMDEEFLDAMDIGLPPASGIGIGIDRMVMTILDQPSIRDVIYFPTMKPVKNISPIDLKE